MTILCALLVLLVTMLVTTITSLYDLTVWLFTWVVIVQSCALWLAGSGKSHQHFHHISIWWQKLLYVLNYCWAIQLFGKNKSFLLPVGNVSWHPSA